MITSLRLQNFRSYKDGAYEFEPAVNIIVGPNASGKTNILEAVLILARGQSFRGRDVELIKNKSAWARIDAHINNLPRSVKLQKQNQGYTVDKSFVIDDKLFKRLSLENQVAAVYFEPNHLNSFNRGPEQRRDYFDDLLERTVVGYKIKLASYKRTLAQRNALLKRRPAEIGQQIFAWDVRLGETGAQIAVERLKLINHINQRLSKTYNQIAKSKNKVQLLYQPMFPANRYASAMVSRLSSKLTLDIERGFTSMGPHREDIVPHINNKIMSEVASRGEMRSLLLALKVIELELVEKTTGQKPILLLDDVFSELDSLRRQALVSLLKNYQSILTTTDADAVVKYLDKHKLIALSKN